MPRIERKLNENGEILCNTCPVILTAINCDKNRYTCKSCRKTQASLKATENANKVITITEKICSGQCALSLPITDFEFMKANGNHRNECKKCIKTKRANASKKDKSEIIDNVKDKFKKCIECKVEKLITENFGIHTNNFRNVCKSCYNKKKYYDVYRVKKRVQDEPAFIAHNTKIHALWVEKNKEHYTQYMKQYGKSLSGILSMYRLERYISLKNDFSSTKEYEDFLTNMISDNCFYCGFKDEKYYNGIDKIDSSIDYTKENSVSCCYICNFMKNTMDIGSFLRKVREIAIFNKQVINLPEEFCQELKYHSDIELIGGSAAYYDYKRRANNKLIQFDLTDTLFNELIKQDCYLCGLSGDNGIGIDRKDNNIGYTIENCYSCCSYCNYMKKCHNYDDFLLYIKNITMYSTSEYHNDLSNSCSPRRACNLPI
jgi:hypothetical protein